MACKLATLVLATVSAEHISQNSHGDSGEGVAMVQSFSNRAQVHSLSTAKGSDGGGRKILHVYGSPHTGSTFLGSLLYKQGMPYLLEPNNGNKSRLWVDDLDEHYLMHLKCAFTCEKECMNLAVHGRAGDDEVWKEGWKEWNTLDYFCDPKWDVVAFKTVGPPDYKDIRSALPSSILSQVKFLITIRDLRGMLSSSSFGHGGRHDDPLYVCKIPLKEYLSAKELFQDYGSNRVKLALYEDWSDRQESFVPEWFAWAGLGSPKFSTKSNYTNNVFRWHDEMKNEPSVLSDTDCEKWFKASGYPRHPSSLADYDFTAIRNKFEAPFTSDEKATLAAFRSHSNDLVVSGPERSANQETPFELWLPAME